jgi:MYXO-CTERM domain-containing protein
MKSAMLIVGIFAVLMGLLWVGQGVGLVQWPASSFMIDQRPWATRGALLALVGVVLIALWQRRNRPLS